MAQRIPTLQDLAGLFQTLLEQSFIKMRPIAMSSLSPSITEELALFSALKEAFQRGFFSVTLESDSQLLIKVFKAGKYMAYSNNLRICLHPLSKFLYLRRTSNVLADALAINALARTSIVTL